MLTTDILNDLFEAVKINSTTLLITYHEDYTSHLVVTDNIENRHIIQFETTNKAEFISLLKLFNPVNNTNKYVLPKYYMALVTYMVFILSQINEDYGIILLIDGHFTQQICLGIETNGEKNTCTYPLDRFDDLFVAVEDMYAEYLKTPRHNECE
jgi:hypothetical protein